MESTAAFTGSPRRRYEETMLMLRVIVSVLALTFIMEPAEADVRIPVTFNLIYSFDNTRSENWHRETREYEWGSTIRTEESIEKSRRDSVVQQIGVKVAVQYGLSALSSLSVEGSYSRTNTHETGTVNYSMRANDSFVRQSTTWIIEVKPGTAMYVYQPGFEIDGVWTSFRDRIQTSEPLEFGESFLDVQGAPMPLLADPTALFHIVSMHPTGGTEKKLLAQYGDSPIYMGDLWVMSSLTPADRASSSWKFIQAEGFSPAVYYIQNIESGKLLSWYEGAKVYAGDPSVMRSDRKLSSLWRILPDLERDDMFYISHFQKGTLLSWYEGADIYAGNDWVIGKGVESDFSSEWKIVRTAN